MGLLTPGPTGRPDEMAVMTGALASVLNGTPIDAPPPATSIPVRRIHHRERNRKRGAPRPRQTARELEAMAIAAREGIPPANSPGDRDIDQAQKGGDYSAALTLREEVKERAPDLDRLARAQAKRERRERARRGE